MAHSLAASDALAIPAPQPQAVPLKRPVLTTLALILVIGSVLGAAIAIKPILGALVLVAAAAALALSQRPQLSVYLMVTLAPSCAGIQRGLLIPGLRISEAAIVGLGFLVLIFAREAQRPRWTGVETLLLAYAVLTVTLGGADLMSRHAPLNTEELGTLLGPFQFVILLRAVIVTMTEEHQRERAAQLMVGAAAIVGLIALAQYANLGPTRSVLSTLTGGTLYTKSLGEGIGRVTGPFSIWHELAGFLMPSILLSLTLLLTTRSRLARLGYGIAFSVTLMALLSTATAGISLATLVGALYILWKRGVLHIALAGAVPIAVIGAILFGSSLSGRAEQQYAPSAEPHRSAFVPQSISYRYELFKEQNAPALSGRWATGYGPDLPLRLALGNFPFAETTYVLLLMRGGVPLLAAFLLLTFAVIRSARRAQRSAETDFEWSIATVVLVTSVAYVFLQLIESYLIDSGPPQAYWAIVGLMLAATGAGSRSRSKQDPPTTGRTTQ